MDFGADFHREPGRFPAKLAADLIGGEFWPDARRGRLTLTRDIVFARAQQGWPARKIAQKPQSLRVVKMSSRALPRPDRRAMMGARQGL
jgi:hypothetical protein